MITHILLPLTEFDLQSISSALSNSFSVSRSGRGESTGLRWNNLEKLLPSRREPFLVELIEALKQLPMLSIDWLIALILDSMHFSSLFPITKVKLLRNSRRQNTPTPLFFCLFSGPMQRVCLSWDVSFCTLAITMLNENKISSTFRHVHWLGKLFSLYIYVYSES